MSIPTNRTVSSISQYPLHTARVYFTEKGLLAQNSVAQAAAYATAAGNSASAASTSAGNAAASASAAVTSAANAAALYATFHNVYYGSSSTPPATRPDGSSRQGGDMYYQSVNITDGARAGLQVWSANDLGVFSWVPSSTTPETIDDRVSTLLVPGANIGLSYNDAANTLTIATSVTSTMAGEGFRNYYNTIDAAQLSHIPPEIKCIALMGAHSAGDAGPPMICERTNGPITNHDGWLRSSDRYRLDSDIDDLEDSTNGGYWEYRSRNQPIWIEWFGGKGDYFIVTQSPPYYANVVNPTPTDNRAPFHSALKFFYTHIQYVGFPGAQLEVPLFSSGPNIQFGYGSYYCSDQLVPDRGSTIAGFGGSYHDGPRTELIFPAGKSGILTNTSANYIPGFSDGIVKDIFFRCLGQGGQTDKHGFTMKIGAVVERCGFTGFGGDGINIVNHTGTSNGNFFYLNRCVIYDCAGHGVYCQGAESNGGTGYALSVRHNGGWGIKDASYLGSFFYGCLEEFNEGGPYYSEGFNGRGVFMACYNEGYHTPSYVGPYSHAIGGTRASGTIIAEYGSSWIYNEMSSFSLAPQAPGHNISVRLGHYSIPNIIYMVSHTGAFETDRFMYTPGAYMFTYGYNVGENVSYTITTDEGLAKWGRQTGLEKHRFGVPEGLYLGGDRLLSSPGSGVMRHIGYAEQYGWSVIYGLLWPPREYLKGDIWIDVDNFGGSNTIGHICTQAGTYAPTWYSGTTEWGGRRFGGFTKNLVGNYYRARAYGPGNSTSQPTHTDPALDDTAYPDGWKWTYLGPAAAVFRRFGPIMGAGSTTVNDPIFVLTQQWNNAALQFTGVQTHITATAAHFDSVIEEWAVNGSRKASVRMDGVFLSNGVPVVRETDLDELRETITALQTRVTQLEAANG